MLNDETDYNIKKSKTINSFIKNNSFNVSLNSKNEENRNFLDSSIASALDINLGNLEMGSKILCPEDDCFLNSIISINPYSFEIYSECRDEHKNKMDIFNYINKSGKSKEENQICDYCNKTFKNILKNNIILYKCSYGKNICQKCKEEKIKGNTNEHILVEFKEKDYTCLCNQEKKKYINYCFECEKNLCIYCSDNHKNHDKKKFSQIFQIGKEKINILKRKLQEQKNTIKTFNKILDDWIKRIIDNINKYRRKMELYAEINEKVINQYNSKKNFYESIKNIEYINFDFDDYVYDIIKSENNYRTLNNIIFKFLNDNMRQIYEINFDKETELKNIEVRDSIEFNGPVHHIYELKNEELLIINIRNQKNNNEEFYIYKKALQYKFNEIFNSFIEKEEILNLLELKNGNLLIVQRNQFKIIEISQKEKLINIIQIHNISEQDYTFKEIILLKNGNLVSLLINQNNQNKIIIWKKNLMKGKYEEKKEKIRENAFSIIEFNKYSFLVYCSNNDIYIYDSNTYEENKKGRLTDIDIEFKAMKKCGEDGILFIFKELLIILNLSTFGIKTQITSQIYDICKVKNSNNYFLATFYEKNNNFYGIYLIKCNSIQNEIICKKYHINLHTNVINCIYQLDNRDTITGSSDNCIKILKLTS